MSRYLFVSSDDRGHVHPMLCIAERLEELGHEIGWLGFPGRPPGVDAHGYQVFEVPAERAPEMTEFDPAFLELIVQNAELHRARWLAMLGAVPAQVEDVRAVYRDYRPDAAVLDPTFYAGVIAAHVAGTRFAAVWPNLFLCAPRSIPWDRWALLDSTAEERDRLFRDFGMEPSFAALGHVSPHLNLALTTEALVEGVPDRLPLPPRSHYVGPARPLRGRGDDVEFPWERLRDGAPLVYLSFGTAIFQPAQTFALVAEACAPLGADLVIAAHKFTKSRWTEGLPGHVVAVEYAPQLALLDRASLFLTHGGFNSVVESLDRGVPLLVSPIWRDQPLQAHVVGASGAGVHLDLQRARVAEVREVVAGAIGQGSAIARAAARIQGSFRAQDGARRSAELIAAL